VVGGKISRTLDHRRELSTVQSLPNKTLAASNPQLNAELKIIVVAFLYYELIENLRGTKIAA
jgi:hypothetical protein